MVEKYLKEKNINFIHGLPFNPHSQGVVERFHKTIKDSLYSLYSENKESFDIIQGLDIVIKKYNNHDPNQIFYSNNHNLYKKVLTNMKNTFKNIKVDNANFKENENVY